MGTFNKERVLIGAISGHCETSRRIVDSSSQQPGTQLPSPVCCCDPGLVVCFTARIMDGEHKT